MKMIRDFWKKDDITRNAQEIARRAGALYDKLVGFVENMQETGKFIGKAHESWNAAYKQLHTGKGNLIGQAEQMKILQIKNRNRLPKTLVENALLEDGIELSDPTSEQKEQPG